MNEPSPKSLQRDLAERALAVMPGGVSHDGRQMEPHGLFIQSAEGARKFDPDGRSYIDFACGNGAVILGHGHKGSIDAVTKAASRGFHFSAGSEIELRWAELVKSLMPAAEQVRFTSSGNEACLLALAVARATTKKSKILTVAQHYNGWAIPAVLPKLPLRGRRECCGLQPRRCGGGRRLRSFLRSCERYVRGHHPRADRCVIRKGPAGSCGRARRRKCVPCCRQHMHLR